MQNGDFRPFGAVSRRPERCVAAKPGSGDGKIVGKAAKPGRWVPPAGIVS